MPRPLQWLVRPQLAVGFAVLCLGISLAGVWERQANYSALPFSQPKQVAAATDAAPSPSMCSIVPCIALTFDDGPSPEITPQVLDILAKHQARATFYVVGSRVAGHEAMLRRIHHDGHEIGNHSWNHPDLSKLSPEEVQSQLAMTQRAIADAGVPAPKTLRPPYGAVNEMVAAHNHLSVIRWNVDPEDWKGGDASKIAEHMVTTARPGAIILLHDTYPATAAAVDQAIPVLKQQYQLVTVSQLLNLSPGDQGQYFSR